ncbi:MAG: tetratricopeptide repeat protein [Alphaproteobacteria bacterium]|jgi:tetratricopeptide (TPR) repeat protein|nr:tetratricopeptide repeat protein [Alphaproteobacteria bacterium]MBT5859793.1 tetratricopeptide repeat protein [Alphaproteobacteria bacterium]
MFAKVRNQLVGGLAALILVAFMVPALPSTAAADAMADLDAAITAFQRNDLQGALDLIDGAIATGELEPSVLAGAHNNRGIIFTVMERPEDAVGAYTQALAVSPGLPQALRGRAVALNVLSRFLEALPDFDLALADRPDDPYILNQRGLAYVGIGDHVSAANDFQAALDLDPGYLEVRLNLLEALKASGQSDRIGAVEAGEAVIDGQTQYGLGNYEKALAYFSQALDLDQNNGDALFERGRAFISLGRFAEAIEDFDTLIAFELDNPTAYFNRALAYENLDEFALAVADYTSSIALDATNLDAFSRRARGYAKLMNYEAAVADYTVILDQKAFNTSALRSRGYAAFNLGRFDLTNRDHALAVLDEQVSDATRMFNAIWSYLAANHLGLDASSELAANMQEISDSTNRFVAQPVNVFSIWPGPVAALYLGFITPEALRAYGVASEFQTQAQRMAEVTFYLGQYYLAQGDVAQARDYFQQTLATGVTSYFEYSGAVAELGRIGAP